MQDILASVGDVPTQDLHNGGVVEGLKASISLQRSIHQTNLRRFIATLEQILFRKAIIISTGLTASSYEVIIKGVSEHWFGEFPQEELEGTAKDMRFPLWILTIH